MASKTTMATRYVVRAGKDRATFVSMKDANKYMRRCGKPKLFVIPPTR